MKRSAWSCLTLAALLAALIVGPGCDSNEDVTSLDGKGRIGVYPAPNDVKFPWTLAGPNGYAHADSGDVVLTDLAPGAYTLTWNTVNGWVVPTPAEMSGTLAANAFLSFEATYRPTGQAQPGQVQLNPNPDTIADGAGAPWTLTGPGGLDESGNGDRTFTDMPSGDYTVVWGETDGWEVSSPETGTETLTLEEGAGLTFNATYSSTEASSFDFVEVPAGQFVMGSARTNPSALPYEWPDHQVTLTRGFLMTETEVTWAQFERIMGYNPTYFITRDWPEHPVDNVSWLEAVEFCNALSILEGFTPVYSIAGDLVTWDRDADGYRLPTEAEWEYACRAGTTSELYNGSIAIQASSCYQEQNLELIAWYCNNSDQLPQAAGQLAPNDFGLYDMSGNLWEWVWDVNDAYDSVTMFMEPFYESLDEDPSDTGIVTVAAELAQFGSSQVLRIVDANTRFSLLPMGITTESVSFQFLDFDGVENFRVNNLPADPYIGDLADLPADLVPGVTIGVTTAPTTHDTFGEGIIGTVTLTGNITSIEVGGSLLWVDTFVIADADASDFGLDRTMDFDLNRLNSFFLPDGNSVTSEATFGCTVTDPIGPQQFAASQHMLRGGSYGSVPRRCRSAARSEPEKGRFAGFRVVRTLD